MSYANEPFEELDVMNNFMFNQLSINPKTMVYTIQNKCIEEPELVYNDGVTIFYFNTTGTKGGSDELKKFLEYLETSKSTHASTSATKELQGYVNMIKHDAEIGGNYVTFGDLMDKVAAEAAAEVCAEKDAIIAQNEAAIAEKDALIAELQAKLEEQKNK